LLAGEFPKTISGFVLTILIVVFPASAIDLSETMWDSLSSFESIELDEIVVALFAGLAIALVIATAQLRKIALHFRAIRASNAEGHKAISHSRFAEFWRRHDMEFIGAIAAFAGGLLFMFGHHFISDDIHLLHGWLDFVALFLVAIPLWQKL